MCTEHHVFLTRSLGIQSMEDARLQQEACLQLQALEPLSATLVAEELAVSITMVARNVRLKLISIMDLVGLEVLTIIMAALITTLEVVELAAQTITISVGQLTTGLTLAVCLAVRSEKLK